MTASTLTPQTPAVEAATPAAPRPYFVRATHGRGKVFTEPVDVVDAITQSGLDYVVTLTDDDVIAPMTVPGGTVHVPMTGFKGVVRVNPDGGRSALGVVKSAYRICQNVDAFDFAQSLLDDFDANVVAAAADGNPLGARAYLALRLPQTLMAGGQDPHDVYVIVTNSHDGSSALTARVSAIRRVNGVEVVGTFVGAPMAYTIRHSGDVGAKMREAIETMETVNAWVQTYERATYALLGERMTEVEFDQFAKKVLPTPSGSSERAAQQWADRRLTLRRLFTDMPAQAFGRGTRYAAFMAFCEYVDRHAPTRGGDPDTVRIDRLLSGRATRAKEAAWKALTA